MKPRIRKILAELFAGLIPHKRERDRWRGLLRYGPWRTLRLARAWRRLRRESESPDGGFGGGQTKAPPIYLAVCAIAKNEGPYFDEWIAWHRARGVEKFYIYDNESTDDTAAVLAPHIGQGVVEYVFWPGRRQQIPAYDDCIERHRDDARWLAFLDLDEFIVPLKHASVPDYLRTMERHPAVEINWLVYGSSGEKTKKEGGVMERFRRHSPPDHEVNRHVKSVVDPHRVACMSGCHESSWLPGTGWPVDSGGGATVRGQFARPPVQDAIRINHYAVKSQEEFMEKRARGRARTLDLRGMDYFERFDLNDIQDDPGLPSRSE